MAKKVSITKSKLDNLALTISEKSNLQTPLTIDEMADAVYDYLTRPSGTKSISSNGTHNVSDYANVLVNVEGGSILGTKTIAQNGTYTAEDDSLDGYSQVVVNIPTGGVQDEWVVLTSGNLHDSTSDVANTYISGTTETSYNGWSSTDYIPVKANTVYQIKNHPGGQYNALYKSDKTGAVSSLVVPGNSNNGYSFIKTTSDTAYIRMSETTAKVANIEIYETAIQMPTGNLAITANGNYTVSQYESVSVAVPTGSPSLQSKTATPSESQQTITPDSGYDGLSAVTVNAVSSTYIGSQIDRNDSTDLTASGATVTVPAGYYAEQASKAVASGSATTPATSVTANPSISVSASGLITATASATKSVTPTVSAGYVSSGTAGTVTVSGSNTQQLSTQAATTITPTTSSQTAVAAGKYTTGAVTVGPIPSNYIIPSGNKEITENGTGIDVSQYETVSVSVSGSSSMNTQAWIGRANRQANSYGATSATLTVAKTGTYTVSWTAWRSSSQGTMGTNLHVNNTSGTNQTTFTNTYGQQIQLTNQNYNVGDVLTIYATSGSSSRSINVSNLIIVQTA